MKKCFLGIKNGNGWSVFDRLENMGYESKYQSERDIYRKWIFIVIDKDDYRYGKLITYIISDKIGLEDYEIDIESVPLREDLDEWVDMFNEGNKLGLL